MVDPVVNPDDDGIDESQIRGSPEWKDARTNREVWEDWNSSTLRRTGTPLDYDFDDIENPDEWVAKAREAEKITYARLMDDLKKQGVDFNKFKNKDGKVYLRDPGERTEISSKDEKFLVMSNYHMLRPKQQKGLLELMKKVGSVGTSRIRAEAKAYVQKQDSDVEAFKIEAREEVRLKKIMAKHGLEIARKASKQQLASEKEKQLWIEQTKDRLRNKQKKLVQWDRELVEPENWTDRFEVKLTDKNPNTGKTYRAEGWKAGETIIGMDSFMKKFDDIPDIDWKKSGKCMVYLTDLYKTAGIPLATEPGDVSGIDISSQCQEIAKSLGSQADKERDLIMTRSRALKDAERMEKEIDLQEEIDDLSGLAADIKNQMVIEKKGTKQFDVKLSNIMALTDKKSQKRQLANFLAAQKVSKPGFMAGIKAKVKVTAGMFPGLEKLREEGSEVAYQRRMGTLLDTIRSSRTSASKRATLTGELQATFDAAEAAGFTPQSAVAGYLKSRPEGSEAVSPLSEEDESGGKLDVLKDVGSTIGSSVAEAGHGLGETIGGNTGNSISDIGGEMAGMAKAMDAGSTDLDQFGSSMGKSGSPLESMSTEHDGDDPIHGSMKLKSVTLGKTEVGSGNLFEQTMAESSAGVKLGDWNPAAFSQQEPRGEKFLRERGAPTEGEAGPVGGDLEPGTMAFDFTAGTGPGTRKLDLGAGQFTSGYTPSGDFTFKPREQRSTLDLGLGSSFGNSVAEGGGVGIGARDKLVGHDNIDRYPQRIDKVDARDGAIENARAHGHDTHSEPQRANLNLGLKTNQRPTTGVNLLGLGNVKAPSVTRVTATKRGGNGFGEAGSLIDQVAGKSGLDTSHLIGNTPKKKRKMNLFGGMPR